MNESELDIILTTDEGLGKELVDPLVGDTYGLRSHHASSLLIDPLLPDVQHQLLHVLRCERDKHTKEEVALDLLQILE